MAAASTLLAFDIVKFGNGDTRNFMCKSVKVRDNQDFDCFPLILNDVAFYGDDDTAGWARAIQVGAVFGVVAAATGTFACSLLFTSTCFGLSARRIVTIGILQACAGFFSILSLMAGAADVCKYADLGDNVACDNGRARLDQGALFMLAAFFLYIAAIVMNFGYLQHVRRQEGGGGGTAAPTNKQEVQPLTGPAGVATFPPAPVLTADGNVLVPAVQDDDDNVQQTDNDGCDV